MIPGHKDILAIVSPEFKKMFSGPKEPQVIEMSDISWNGFEKRLQFLYSTNVALTMKNISEVTRLTYKYQVSDCCNTCVEFLLANHLENDIIWMYQLALDINNDDLKNYCEKFISQNSKKLFESDEFQSCDQNMLKRILQMDMLSCPEIDVFHACLTWAKCACKRNESENVKQQLGDCFNLIRFGTMDTNEFIIHTLPYKDLFTREEYEDILYKTSVKFNHTPRLNPYLCGTKPKNTFYYPCMVTIIMIAHGSPSMNFQSPKMHIIPAIPGIV
ncbi:BTB/POZ domain-containing protein 2-like [Sitodiplosis mosellana]|uniref:BTB/POZ domain-containing protein 2-like n=1 Tax=Sitodiplosis mosellana TaxID=263140 RepID=UPI0024451547|nr:BTB/POZ domain-containing protein 2-like [Sitodiplosis mosellana]